MVVMTMTAVDYDDPAEGTNAKLIYSIEKNVIEEETGTPIFEIESDTGVIKTAVCCLDRERTPDYSIQVVAMDGGGLKGKKYAVYRNGGHWKWFCVPGRFVFLGNPYFALTVLFRKNDPFFFLTPK